MVRRRTRKNPSPSSAPPTRRLAGGVAPAKLDSSLSRVRKLAKGLDERDRPFSPERPGTWRGSSRDLVVNQRRKTMRKNSYELSFSPEFFFAEGEPYDALSDTKRPVSVWAAIEGMRLHHPEQWAELAKEVFGLDNPEYLTSETVMDKIRETNTCGTLSSPVDVYIDPEGWFTVDVYDEMRDNSRRLRRNAEQTRFPGMGVPPEIQIGTFSWRQVGGDMDPGGHGGLIARANGDQIELIEIQPVREYVGDGEAADVGFPFWTREASYDLDDLSLDKKDVQSALQSMDIDTDALEAITPDQRALAIAEALMRYGYAVEEGQGGWSKDIVRFPVEWWGGTTATFEEYCGDEDDEFRRDVLNEEWHYIYGSGMKGYLFDNGPYAAESVNDAVDSLVDTFTSGDPSISDDEEKRMRAALIKGGYWEFDNPKEIGAEYCEITREDGPMPEDEE
jgi:hypothetical protein